MPASDAALMLFTLLSGGAELETEYLVETLARTFTAEALVPEEKAVV